MNVVFSVLFPLTLASSLLLLHVDNGMRQDTYKSAILPVLDSPLESEAIKMRLLRYCTQLTLIP
jgi:hypothetical protein